MLISKMMMMTVEVGHSRSRRTSGTGSDPFRQRYCSRYGGGTAIPGITSFKDGYLQHASPISTPSSIMIDLLPLNYNLLNTDVSSLILNSAIKSSKEVIPYYYRLSDFFKFPHNRLYSISITTCIHGHSLL